MKSLGILAWCWEVETMPLHPPTPIYVALGNFLKEEEGMVHDLPPGFHLSDRSDSERGVFIKNKLIKKQKKIGNENVSETT
jgi:hypothetical protein